MRSFRGWDWKVFMWVGALAIIMILALLSKRRVMAEQNLPAAGEEDGAETAGEVPVLAGCAIEGEVRGEDDGVPLYWSQEKEDVILSFSIADQEENWKPDGVRFQILNTGSRELVVDIDGTGLKWEGAGEEPGLYRAVFSFDGEPGTEAVYEARISYRNRAGDLLADGRGQPDSFLEYGQSQPGEGFGRFEADTGTFFYPAFSLDHRPPELTLDFVVNPDTLADAVNYKDFGYWFSEEIPRIKTMAEDGISGIREIQVTLTGENGEERELAGEFSLGEIKEWEEFISPETEDFRGLIRMRAVDWCGNTAELARGCVVESAEKHGQMGKVEIVTKTAPSRTVNGVDYYNGDVELGLKWQDPHAGLKKVSYMAGDGLSGETDYGEQAGRDFEEEPLQELVYGHSEEVTLEAALNNRNGVLARAGYVDNVGHTGSVESSYNIDTTPPVILVEYDDQKPVRERYYARARTAVVTIQERNFDPGDVEFRITGTNGASPHVSGWSSRGSGDDTENWCTVTFDQDGDYTFSVAFQDMAGNPAAYDRVDSFTIDQTPPRLRAFYDNNESRNGHYFARGRRLTIEVSERNFDGELIEILIQAEGGDATPPAVSPWTEEGDIHRAHVTFGEDGVYRVGIAGEDLAGHSLPEYEGDHFVIDQTPPAVEIRDIRDRSANKGAVTPEILCSDANYDPGSVKIRLEGSRTGVGKAEGDRSDHAEGMKLRLKDIPHVQARDDRYVLYAEACDLAGNKSQASVEFSVNRFGSVYTFSEDTEALVGEKGRYYTKRGQDLVVTETNVDTLEFREITCDLGGRLRLLREDIDYRVRESGSGEGWKEYTYLIGRDSFLEEGEYVLTIYSRDRAGNSSASGARGKRIAFAVDRTAPDIRVSGVEDGGRYMESSRQVTLDIQDNLRLEEVKVMVNGKEQIYTAADMAENDGRLTLLAESASHWQKLDVTARDAAGNVQTTGEVRFLVTPNGLIQFFRDPALSGGSCALLLVLAGCGAGLAGYKRSRGRRREALKSAVE